MNNQATLPLEVTQPVYSSPPAGMPSREEFVAAMLGRTRRHGTPIRSAFVQRPRSKSGETRASMLPHFTRSSHLDAFLLIHALSTAKEPYEATYPAASWARALGLDETTGAGDEDLNTAKTQWSKITRKLVGLNLVRRDRAARRAKWMPLHESGDGSDYTRPKLASDGNWFTVPEDYWTKDHYRTLTLPAKKMLLIALSNKPEFVLPLERASDWYGVSRSTAQRGFAELEAAGILTYTQGWRFDPSNPRNFSEERVYHLLGAYSHDSIREAMGNRKTPKMIAAVSPEEAPDKTPSARPATSKVKRKKKKGGDIK